MKNFYGTPVFDCHNLEIIKPYLHCYHGNSLTESNVIESVNADKIVLINGLSQFQAGELFSSLVDFYELRDSYEVQMKFVVHMLADREAVDDIAVTVNDRGPYQIIQAHSEGDSTSPLELLALYCKSNTDRGGENIFSLVNQRADLSRLRAKEKFIVGAEVNESDLQLMRQMHRDIKDHLLSPPEQARTLFETDSGSVVVAPRPLARQRSTINCRDVITLWDNVTVHDHAFHQHQYELVSHLDILRRGLGDDYERYMHVEVDSPWAPADTHSGSLEQTAQLFQCHLVHKLNAGDLVLLNNRSWTHAVNNWEPEEQRRLIAMYA